MMTATIKYKHKTKTKTIRRVTKVSHGETLTFIYTQDRRIVIAIIDNDQISWINVETEQSNV